MLTQVNPKRHNVPGMKERGRGRGRGPPRGRGFFPRGRGRGAFYGGFDPGYGYGGYGGGYGYAVYAACCACPCSVLELYNWHMPTALHASVGPVYKPVLGTCQLTNQS